MERMCKKTCRLCRPSTSETRKLDLPLLNDDSKLSLFSQVVAATISLCAGRMGEIIEINARPRGQE